MNGLEQQYGDQVKFVRLNALAEGQTAFEAGNFPGHPAVVIMLPDGEEIWRGFGVVSAMEMEDAIQQALQKMD